LQLYLFNGFLIELRAQKVGRGLLRPPRSLFRKLLKPILFIFVDVLIDVVWLEALDHEMLADKFN
jgi:hypothetical protein